MIDLLMQAFPTEDCPIILVPAYGRKYSTDEAILADYEAGKDFKIFQGPYCSKRDFQGKKVNLMYIHENCRMYVEA